MTNPDRQLEAFEALIGTWAIEATHPEVDAVVTGRVTYEWLSGGRFLIQRTQYDHELFPEAISVIGAAGAGGGLSMEYFDSRGVRRTYEVSLDDGVLRTYGKHPEFEQRVSATLGSPVFHSRGQLARSPGEWQEDLSATYRRVPPAPTHLFAGLRVRDFHAALPWYERVLGVPAFLPHAHEAVWTLAAGGSLYVVEHPDGAGTAVVTIVVADLDERVAVIAARGVEPDERESLANGVRKAIDRDAEGNEVVFGAAPLDADPRT